MSDAQPMDSEPEENIPRLTKAERELIAHFSIPAEELEWAKSGVCSVEHVPTEVFFFDQLRYGTPEYRAALARAKSFCNRCPVKQACLRFAINHETPSTTVGVWGGKTPWGRSQIKYPRRFVTNSDGTRRLVAVPKEQD